MNRGVRRLTEVLTVTALVAFVLAAAGSAQRTTGRTGEIAPAGTSMVDCNGWSPKYPTAKQAMQMLCTDPISLANGKASRFNDNGWYIGHDEPSVKFISSAPGSANHMTYYMRLAVDPVKAPTVSGSVTDYAELSPAPWFGLPICDPHSYPQQPCTPDSDTNTSNGSPTDAGSAFLELQFYPPGFGPWLDAPSCDATRYCAALNIDSLECTYGFASCNSNCIEPVNFAWLQTDGVPTGPASPQLANAASGTFVPNAATLKMNQGDSLKVTIEDTPAGLEAVVDDLTTGQSGFMVASAANGFMNTDIATCGGTPFSFHPEYSTAAKQNQVPWAALEGGVLMEDETGHFESCNSVTNQLGLAFDLQTYQTCVGGNEGGSKAQGEGPCSFTTGTCGVANTEGGGACPSNSFLSGLPCEFSDATCIPAGPRAVTIPFETPVWSWPIAGCEANFFQNGDLDFDGLPYQRDWPDGTPNHPSPFAYAGPFDQAGNPYPQVQFETDIGGSEIDCNTTTGVGCTARPQGASFYPFWTIGKQPLPTGFPASAADHGSHTACLWNFGNNIIGVTTENFGGDHEYGQPDLAEYGGTLASAVMPNPQLGSHCEGTAPR